jgi:hypothetical protein
MLNSKENQELMKKSVISSFGQQTAVLEQGELLNFFTLLLNFTVEKVFNFS